MLRVAVFQPQCEPIMAFEVSQLLGMQEISIPLTDMHRLFRSVSKLPHQDQLQCAERLIARPDRLRACFERSVEQFEPYSNIDQPFHPGIRKAAEDVRPIGARFCLALGCGYRFEAEPTLDFDFVDREVVPSRTTPRTVFTDGSPARNQPRVDALLVNRGDRLPIVAEIKVCRDKTPFVALVQALAGAAQLVTKAQRDRLQAHYPAAELRLAAELTDIYLIFVNPPGPARYWHDLRRYTRQLAKYLAEGRMLRRIELIDAVYVPPHHPELKPDRVM
jgi:hypothetical protein